MIAPKEINLRIAKGYDFLSYEANYPQWINPKAIQMLARPYGATGELRDVLDLGCGGGSLLAEAGDAVRGRLVGADISARSCEKAKENLARHGERVEIINADFLELTAKRLGEFDLIYCTGVIYIVPPAVREHLFELIGTCLRPGGIALISYYSGLSAAVRAHLGRSLRALTPESEDPSTKARNARVIVDQPRAAAQRPGHYALGLRAALKYVEGKSDEHLFAELLNQQFDSMTTGDLNQSLAAGGAEFATYLCWKGLEPWYSASDRALMADRLDLAGGYYHCALFVKRRGIRPDPPAGQRAKPNSDEIPKPNWPRPRSLRRSARSFARYMFWLIFRV